jgi:hypothetical protein
MDLYALPLALTLFGCAVILAMLFGWGDPNA